MRELNRELRLIAVLTERLIADLTRMVEEHAFLPATLLAAIDRRMKNVHRCLVAIERLRQVTRTGHYLPHCRHQRETVDASQSRLN